MRSTTAPSQSWAMLTAWLPAHCHEASSTQRITTTNTCSKRRIISHGFRRHHYHYLPNYLLAIHRWCYECILHSWNSNDMEVLQMNRVAIHGNNKAALVKKLNAYKPPAKRYIPCPCIFCAAQHR